MTSPKRFCTPPQARRLARAIALDTPSDTQIVISTHSHDFVQGLLDYATDRVNVVRIIKHTDDKGKTTNRIRKLAAADVAEFWRDPLLKTSDALTSLFHDVAIIVEGDSDARFFRAMLDAVYKESGEYLPDIRFFHCGGKDRIPKIASALRSVGLPLICVVDIDIINDKQKFHALLDAFGGSVAKVSDDLDYIHRFVQSRRSPITSSEARAQINAIFDALDPKNPIPADKSHDIQEICKNHSAWQYVKSTGEQFFTGGDPFNRFKHLCSEANKHGIVVNRAGELENLCKTITPRKAEWLACVLQKDLAQDPDLEIARSFTRDLVSRCKEALSAVDRQEH